MSLNGLDTSDVQDAYQTAVGEPGGWFLLKYVSRDAVELLGRGKNGVNEARNAIAAYSDASPLYGLIIYRRRKILIKYIPEGTSRLLQARTAVHFQDVLEKYSPYETLLDITTGEGLNDTALAASFHLHTASPSPSASRLDEIREDEDDSGSAPGLPSSTRSSSLNPLGRMKGERRAELLKRKSERPERLSSLNAGLADIPRGGALNSHPPTASASQKPSMSQFLVREESGRTSITALSPPFPDSSAHEHRDSDLSTKSADSTRKASDVPDSASQTTQDVGELTDATEVQSSPEQPPKPPKKDVVEPLVDPRNRELPVDPRHRELPIDPRHRELPKAPEHPPPPPPPPKAPERAARSADNIDVRSVKPAPPGAEGDDFDWKEYYDSMFTPKPKLGPRPVTSADKTKRPAAARVSALPPHYRPVSKRQEPSRPKSSMQDASPAPATHHSIPITAHPMSAPVLVPPPVPDEPEYAHRPVSRGSIKSTHSHKTMMTPDKLRLMKAVELRKRQMRKSQGHQAAKPVVEEDVPEVPRAPMPEVPRAPEPVQPEKTKADRNPDLERVIDDESQPQSAKADSGIEMQGSRTDEEEDQASHVQPSMQETEPSPEPERNTTKDLDETPAIHDEPPQPPIPQRDMSPSSLEADEAPIVERQISEQPSEAGADLELESPAIPQIVMADGSRPITSDGQPWERKASSSATSTERQASEAPSSDETLEALDSPKAQDSDLAKRRRGYVEPLQLEINSGNPDDFVSDDEDFLEELHSAEVQEARPIMVSRSSNTSKSPVNSGLADRRPSVDTASVRSINITRANTMPIERAFGTPDRLTPEISNPSRSAVTSPSDVGDPMSSYSRNVSSGISRRIQALAEMSSREAAHAEYASRSTSRSRPTSFRRHSSNRTNQATAGASAENTPPASSWSVQHDPITNRNSVSVTARIVRPTAVDETNADEAQLQQSELTINRQRESNGAEASSVSTSKANSAVSSPAISPVLARFSGEVRTMHSAAATRLGRHRQGSTPSSTPGLDEFPPPPTTKGTSGARSVVSTGSNDENANPKEGGRTSRFFKRMSNFGGPKRKNSAVQAGASATSLASIASNEGNNASQHAAVQRKSMASEKLDMPPPVVVGDLNVQFPDSLLWKRRIVTIDEMGHLQFAIAQAMEIHKGVALKKFPLADFKQPFAPDLDSEELPNSIVLELHDGTFLQTACEDAMTQRQVLHLLKTYWRAWAPST